MSTGEFGAGRPRDLNGDAALGFGPARSVATTEPEPPAAAPSLEALEGLELQKPRQPWHPWRWVATVTALVLVAMFVNALATNKFFQWSAFGYWFFRPVILGGLYLTLELTALASVFGLVGGIVLALMRLSKSPVLRTISWGYIWIFRSIPLIVLLLFLANATALYRELSLGIPFGPGFVHFNATQILSFFVVAVLGLSLNEAAYASEVVRSGVISVDPGQREAAAALGLPRWRQYRRIILPQATRTIIPSYANQLIGLLKGTSVVYITSLLELFGEVETQGSTNDGQIVPLLMVGTVWYIVLTTILSIFQYYLERYFARGAVRVMPPTPFQRLRRQIASTSGDVR